MRWTDLPPDRGSPDQAGTPGSYADAAQRGEWQDLRQRLERLPAGHPSSPDAGRGAADNEAEGWAGERQPDLHAAGEAASSSADRSGMRTGTGLRAGSGRPAGPGTHEAGRAPGPEHGERYRPWFASGGSADPWFWTGPGG
jgi:hypothetical protein